MSSFTAAGIMWHIENFCSNKKNILNESSQQFLEKVYSFLFWLIFLAMTGTYVGALLAGALKSIYLQMIAVLLITCLGRIGFKIFSLDISDNCIFDLVISGISGLAMGFLWKGATSGDSGCIADVLLNVSLSICSFRISLILRGIGRIVIIPVLGTTYLLVTMTIENPSFITGVIISLVVTTLVLYRNSLVETEPVCWFYFNGTLLTWLVTNFSVSHFVFGHMDATKLISLAVMILILYWNSLSKFIGFLIGILLMSLIIDFVCCFIFAVEKRLSAFHNPEELPVYFLLNHYF